MPLMPILASLGGAQGEANFPSPACGRYDQRGHPRLPGADLSPTRVLRGTGSSGSVTLVESSGGWSRISPSFGLVEVPHE
jgi:hypothetical protein